jgi:hypothetical protein
MFPFSLFCLISVQHFFPIFVNGAKRMLRLLLFRSLSPACFDQNSSELVQRWVLCIIWFILLKQENSSFKKEKTEKILCVELHSNVWGEGSLWSNLAKSHLNVFCVKNNKIHFFMIYVLHAATQVSNEPKMELFLWIERARKGNERARQWNYM